MKKYLRLPKRKSDKVKQDIEDTAKIVREDIYDVLKESWLKGKTKEEAAMDISDFIKGLKLSALGQYLSKHGNVDEIIRRVVSDIDSYGLDWEANEIK